jgi:hypothetical protein
MNATVVSLFFGLALGGFTAFIIVLVLGAVGLAVGRWLDGRLDLSALTGAGRDRGRPDRGPYGSRGSGVSDRGWRDLPGGQDTVIATG